MESQPKISEKRIFNLTEEYQKKLKETASNLERIRNYLCEQNKEEELKKKFNRIKISDQV